MLATGTCRALPTPDWAAAGAAEPGGAKPAAFAGARAASAALPAALPPATPALLAGGRRRCTVPPNGVPPDAAPPAAASAAEASASAADAFGLHCPACAEPGASGALRPPRAAPPAVVGPITPALPGSGPDATARCSPSPAPVHRGAPGSGVPGSGSCGGRPRQHGGGGGGGGGTRGSNPAHSSESSGTPVAATHAALECHESLGPGDGGDGSRGGGGDDEGDGGGGGRGRRGGGCRGGGNGGGAAALATPPARPHARAWADDWCGGGSGGAASGRARLLCARVSVYSDTTSEAALAVANEVMARIAQPGACSGKRAGGCCCAGRGGGAGRRRGARWSPRPGPSPASIFAPHPTPPLPPALALAPADGVCFQPVHPESVEFHLGVMWGFPAFAVALGCCYFQRLLAAMPHLAAAAARCPPFAHHRWSLPRGGASFAAAASAPAAAGAARHAACQPHYQPHLWPAGAGGHAYAPPAPAADERAAADLEIGLRSAQFVCIYLAAKVADQPHAFGLLRFMLSAITGQRRAVSLGEAADVELRCLAGLGWRLGPFFAEDPMGEGAEALTRLFCWA
jgi:hypothetical protein